MNELHQLALAHAPLRCRDALSALWACDAALGRVVATTSEPLIGQMRLTWWHDRMMALDAGQVPAEPVIAALHPVVRDHDMSGAMLATLIEGWETLLEPMPLSVGTLQDYAGKRGHVLFDLSQRILAVSADTAAGAGWALIDFATRCTDEVTAERAWSMAGEIFATTRYDGPRALRILAGIARARAHRPFDIIDRRIALRTMLKLTLF